MQEGKALHRALQVNRWLAPSAAAIAFMVLSPGNVFGIATVDHQLRPAEQLDPFFSLVRNGYALCYGSCAEPYGIDDLRIYRALIGVRGGRFALWAAWEACAHRLFRRDDLHLRVCVQPFRFPLSFGLEPGMRRDAATGFPPGCVAGLTALAVLQGRGVACSLRREVTDREAFPLVACTVSLDLIFLTVEGVRSDDGFDLREVESGLSIDGLVELRTGYRLDTGEVRCGVGCRRRGIIVTARWAHHPVLGRSVSLGVGCIWPR